MRTLADRRREELRAESDERDLTSRSDKRRQRRASEETLLELGKRLVAQKGKNRAQLPEPLAEVIAAARLMRSHVALERQLRLVRQRLREQSPDVLRALLTHADLPPQDVLLGLESDDEES